MKLYNLIKKSINFWNMSERVSDKLLSNVIWTIFSREASDAGDFHLKWKSLDFRVIFDEKWRSTLPLKYVGLQ